MKMMLVIRKKHNEERRKLSLQEIPIENTYKNYAY